MERHCRSTLYLVGLGVYKKTVTLEALEIMRRACDVVFLESYTSCAPGTSVRDLEDMIGRRLYTVSRRDLEDMNGEVLFRHLREGRDVCLATWGDPLVATTHISLATRALREGFCYRYVPGVSSVTAALGLTGLMIYRLGKISTVTFPRDGVLSEYPYHVLRENMSRGLHTLYLLDIDVERGVFMRVGEAIDLLLRLEEVFREGLLRPETYVLGLSIGERSVVCGGRLEFVKRASIDQVPQILVIPSRLYFTEEEYLSSLGVREDGCVEI